jgi:hypothetical protein
MKYSIVAASQRGSRSADEAFRIASGRGTSRAKYAVFGPAKVFAAHVSDYAVRQMLGEDRLAGLEELIELRLLSLDQLLVSQAAIPLLLDDLRLNDLRLIVAQVSRCLVI